MTGIAASQIMHKLKLLPLRGTCFQGEKAIFCMLHLTSLFHMTGNNTYMSSFNMVPLTPAFHMRGKSIK